VKPAVVLKIEKGAGHYVATIAPDEKQAAK
jgi:hypothetical protein